MIFYSPFQPGLFYDSMITSCAIQVNDTCLGQKHCFFVCVCVVLLPEDVVTVCSLACASFSDLVLLFCRKIWKL